MEIKKFKNGKIKMALQPSDKFYHSDGNGGIDIESLYFNEIEMNDIYLNQINSYQYWMDFNTGLVYDIGSYLLQNPLKYLMDCLIEGSVYLYPLTKAESETIMAELDGDY